MEHKTVLPLTDPFWAVLLSVCVHHGAIDESERQFSLFYNTILCSGRSQPIWNPDQPSISLHTVSRTIYHTFKRKTSMLWDPKKKKTRHFCMTSSINPQPLSSCKQPQTIQIAYTHFFAKRAFDLRGQWRVYKIAAENVALQWSILDSFFFFLTLLWQRKKNKTTKKKRSLNKLIMRVSK